MPTQSSPAAVHAPPAQAPAQGFGAVPVGELPVSEADTTTVGFGQAAPGRDIFPDHPHNDMKSEAIPQRADKGDVDAETPTEGTAKSEDATTSNAAEDDTTSSSSSAAEDLTAVDPTTVAAPEHHDPEGPKVQEEAEADRIREEIFPEQKE